MTFSKKISFYISVKYIMTVQNHYTQGSQLPMRVKVFLHSSGGWEGILTQIKFKIMYAFRNSESSLEKRDIPANTL